MSLYTITKGMTLGQVFDINPGGRDILAGFHIGGCHNCAIDEEDTIEKIAKENEIPIELLINSLSTE